MAVNRFYTKQTKLFGPKNFCILFFQKVLMNFFFVAQKKNLEDTLVQG